MLILYDDQKRRISKIMIQTSILNIYIYLEIMIYGYGEK